MVIPNQVLQIEDINRIVASKYIDIKQAFSTDKSSATVLLDFIHLQYCQPYFFSPFFILPSSFSRLRCTMWNRFIGLY